MYPYQNEKQKGVLPIFKLIIDNFQKVTYHDFWYVQPA